METNNKLREALVLALSLLDLKEGVPYKTVSQKDLDLIKNALAAPPRNCDVYTADELKVIFNSELVLELPIANEHEKNLVTIAAMGVIDTLFAPATEKEGGANG
jgi:hypothetical protein